MDRITQWSTLRNEYQKQLQRPQSAKAVSFNFIDQLSLREMRNLREQRQAELARYQSQLGQEALRPAPDVSEGEIVSEIDSFKSNMSPRSSGSSLSFSSHLSSRDLMPDLGIRPPFQSEATQLPVKALVVEPEFKPRRTPELADSQSSREASPVEESKHSEAIPIQMSERTAKTPSVLGRDAGSGSQHEAASSLRRLESDVSDFMRMASSSQVALADNTDHTHSEQLSEPPLEFELPPPFTDRSFLSYKPRRSGASLDVSQDLSPVSSKSLPIAKIQASQEPSLIHEPSQMHEPKDKTPEPLEHDLSALSVHVEIVGAEDLEDNKKTEVARESLSDAFEHSNLSSIKADISPFQSFDQKSKVLDDIDREDAASLDNLEARSVESPRSSANPEDNSSAAAVNLLTEDSGPIFRDDSRLTDLAATSVQPTFKQVSQASERSYKSSVEPSLARVPLSEKSSVLKERPTSSKSASRLATDKVSEGDFMCHYPEFPSSDSSSLSAKLLRHKQDSYVLGSQALERHLSAVQRRVSRELKYRTFEALLSYLARSRELAVRVVEFRYRWELVHLYQVFQGLRYVCRAHKKWIQEVRRELVRRRTRSYFKSLRHNAVENRLKRYKLYRTLSKTFYSWRAWADRTRSSAVKAYMFRSFTLATKGLKAWKHFYAVKAQRFMKLVAAKANFCRKIGRKALQEWKKRVEDGKQVIPLKIYRQTSISKKGEAMLHRKKLEIKVVNIG